MGNILRQDRFLRVHPDLVKVVRAAVFKAPWPVHVIEGLRTLERQRELVAQGASQTLASRHLAGLDGLARAIDLAPAPGGKPSWAWPLYHILAPIMLETAKELNISVEWGGNWEKFKDGPHWQLLKSTYP